jgi:hypothetical protein
MEQEESGENIKGGSPAVTSQKMTLQKAVDFGEYDPKFLSTLPEWHTLSKHIQFQFIQKAMENRRHQLLAQYAAISNVLDFRLKPELKETLSNIHKQLKQIDTDFEKISLEYFK